MSIQKIKATGGPHGKNTRIEVDGQVQQGVHRVEIALDVNDVVRVKTFTYAEADLDLEGLAEDGGYKLTVRIPDVAPGGVIRSWRTLVEAKGATIRDTLRAAAENVPEDIHIRLAPDV